MRDAAGELHHLEPALYLAVGVRQDLAVFGGDDRGELLAVAFQQFLQLEHDAGTAERRRGRPGRPGGGSRGGGLVNLGRVGERHTGEDLAGGRVEYVSVLATGAWRRACRR